MNLGLTLKKNENSNEMPRNAAFHQDLHRLPRHKISSEKEIQFCLEIITCDHLMYTMDLPKLIVSNQKEESISAIKRVEMPMAVKLDLLSGPAVVFDTAEVWK